MIQRWQVGLLVCLCATVARGQGYAPREALQHMSLPNDLEVHLVASEPLIRQPVCIEFDDRGRLWVLQYLQYPNPAGLDRLKVDRYSRTLYDRMPQPPPLGPRGADCLTILSDRDGDGQMDQAHDFVSGLNLATGMAFGYGGVFVLNVPYLLFYRDDDGNDIPDGDPEVLLTGFGMEDAHSVANSLTWGPDGWLYGCQGSTVTANIRGIEFQQGVWRYHPRTRQFELFCEGGGNAWGLDFDAQGNMLVSTNYGGYVLVHGVRGGNYVKSFAKHGALHHPHAYGYFEHAPHTNFQGGHVTVGGIVYQGAALPARYVGQYIAGDLLGHTIRWHQITPWGSTFRTATGGVLLDSHDTWFASSDVTVGPDGSIYVADWHDARMAHPDPDAQWDRSNGRVLRIKARDTKSQSQTTTQRSSGSTDEINFRKQTSNQLLQSLLHPNQWYVRRARVELARRGEPEVFEACLEQAIKTSDEHTALEAWWTCMTLAYGNSQLQAALTDERLQQLLASPHAAVRTWTVRWLGEGQRITTDLAHRLDELAEQEPELSVRQQLAIMARRLPANQALPVINANINRDVDSADPYLPLLWWWAVEQHSTSGREEVMKRFTRPTLWKSRLGRDVLLPKLVRRYAAEGTLAGLDSILQLLQACPTAEDRHALWASLVDGWLEVPGELRQNRDQVLAEHPLAEYINQQWTTQASELSQRPNALVRLAILQGNTQAWQAMLSMACKSDAPAAVRKQCIGLLSDRPLPKMIPPFLDVLRNSEQPAAIRSDIVRVLAKLDEPFIAEQLLQLLQSPAGAPIESSLYDAIFSRQNWALNWLLAVEAGRCSSQGPALDQIRRLATFSDGQIDRLVTKTWGKLQGASREERLAEVRRLNNDLRATAGEREAGRQLFKQHCAACHRLFGEGGQLGPDLTTANRQDRDFLLISLVDPSNTIRKEYLSSIVRTEDDRIFTGIVQATDGGGVRLLNAKNESLLLTTDEIADVQVSPQSLMPEDLYRTLSPQQLRDLFAYLQSSENSIAK